MHLAQSEITPLPTSRHPATGHEIRYSEFQTSKGLPLYLVKGPLPLVGLGGWINVIAGRVAFLTSLFKLGWPGPDQVVYIDRKRHPDDERDVDLFKIGDAGTTVADQRGVHLNVVMPEKMCLMPPGQAVNGTDIPSVIYAASDEDAVSCIFKGLTPEPFVRGLKHLEDFWVNRGKLWVMTRGEMHSLSEPVKRKLRIYGPNSDLEKEVELSCVACGRPVFVKDKLVFPVQRWSNGPWELTTGSECLWKGVGISNLFTYREGVLCLVSDRPRVWRTLRDGSCSSFGELGEPVGDVSMWDGKLLFHMRDKEREYVVYDSRPSRVFGEIDHASLRVFKGEPVYAARDTRGNGSWQLVYNNEVVGQPCDRVLEIDVSQPKSGKVSTLRAYVLRDNQIVTEAYRI